jgi:hypothetical protein
MRRSHRRLHLLMWLIAAAGVSALAVVVMTQSRPDTIEIYKPSEQ